MKTSIKKRKKQTFLFLSWKALVFRTRRYESEELLSIDGLMGFESITEQVKYLISWKCVNCWFPLIQCVLSCVCSGIVFPKHSSRLRKASSLEFFLWFLLQNQVPAFLVGCNWEGMKAVCSIFLALDSFVLHLISSKSEPELGYSYSPCNLPCSKA